MLVHAMISRLNFALNFALELLPYGIFYVPRPTKKFPDTVYGSGYLNAINSVALYSR